MTRPGPTLLHITLRDYLAAHCPVSFSEFLRGWTNTETATATTSMEAYAVLRYRYADAMLKERLA